MSNDAVNHPSHYTAFPVEVIEIIKDVEKLEKGPRFPYALTEN